jgi:hypothetical protein
MNRAEITTAAGGTPVNRLSMIETKELYDIVCKKLFLQKKQIACNESLEYIAEQIHYRHTYTVDELLLAVDYQNASLLNFKTSAYEVFGLTQILALITAYREATSKYSQPEDSGDVGEEQKKEANNKAAEDLVKMVYKSYKLNGFFKTHVKMIWQIVYDYLLEKKEVTADEFDRCFHIAEKQMRAELMNTGRASQIDKIFKKEMDIGLYQAKIVVDRYMKSKL